MGSLTLILGPMFAQKTTYLRNILIRPSEIGKKVLYINHEDDVRCHKEKFSTHNSQLGPNNKKYNEIKLHKLTGFDVSNYDIIGIDESQFFEDINDVVRNWVIQEKKEVYMVSLNGNYQLKNIGNIHQLIPIASDIILLSALCDQCGKKGIKRNAYCSSLSIENKDLTNDKIIGDKDKYQALCLECFQQNILY